MSRPSLQLSKWLDNRSPCRESGEKEETLFHVGSDGSGGCPKRCARQVSSPLSARGTLFRSHLADCGQPRDLSAPRQSPLPSRRPRSPSAASVRNRPAQGLRLGSIGKLVEQFMEMIDHATRCFLKMRRHRDLLPVVGSVRSLPDTSDVGRARAFIVGQLALPVVILDGEPARLFGRGGIVCALPVIRHAIGRLDSEFGHGISSVLEMTMAGMRSRTER
jgi:hypothetical protein